MDLTEKTLKSEYIFEGRVLKLKKDEVLLPNGKTSTREVVEYVPAVGVLPLTEDNKVIMVRQFRYAYKEVLLEIPAGKMDNGETPLMAANRELSEEIKFRSDNIVSMGQIYPAPGSLNEVMHLFYAKNLIPCSAELDEDEFLEVVYIDFDQLKQKVLSGEIKDAKTVSAVLKYSLLK